MFAGVLRPAVGLMNKLPFKWKIISVTVVLFTLLVLPSKAVFVDYFEKTDLYERQLTGLSYAHHMQTLIAQIQLHRGLVNGYLNGNRNFRAKILDTERKIDRSFLALVSFDKKHLNHLRHNRDFVDAMSLAAIVKLQNVLQEKDARKIFEKHSRIVRDLMHVLQMTSQLTAFAASSDTRLNYIAQLLQDKLLLLEENTGQLRGIAVGIFAGKRLESKQKEQLFARYTLLKSLESYLLDNQSLANVSNFLQLQKQTTLVAHKLDTILDIVYRHILDSDNPKYDSALFFKQATDALEAQVKLYALYEKTYRTLITSLQDEALNQALLLLVGLLSIISIAFYLTVAFYRSVTGSLKKLQTASRMISEGKTDIALTCDTEDELGNAILSFNEMSRNLKKHISFLDGYKMAIDESSIVSKTNPKGIITYANKKFCEISGYTLEELLGMPHNIVRHPDVPKAVFRELWATIKSKRIWKGIVKNRAKNGEAYIVDATIIPVLDNEGNIVEYIGIRHDITELERSKEELRRQRKDLLTGLPNRRQLEEDIIGTRRPILFYLNIDGFAEINDFYGAKIADQVLIYLSQLLTEMFQKERCRLYRFHNDEFFLLFEEGIFSLSHAPQIMEKIIEHIEHETIECDAKNCISVNLSGGISHYRHAPQKEQLLSLAMIARKRAKVQNKKFLMYDPSMNDENDYRKNIEWINKIKDAIRNDRIVPFFQPIIDNRSEAITKYEALVRLIDIDGSVISPFFFLDIAKKAKLYSKITKTMILKTFQTAADVGQCEFSINLTAEDVLDDEVRTFIFEQLQKVSFANRIIFEITESERIDNYEAVNAFIDEVRHFGVKIAIDDFGSGYSNFAHIIGLNADFIKIDGSLIKQIDENEEAAIITEAIIAFSKKIGSKTVVEYVHSPSVYEKVRNLGADYSQGFYLGEPTREIGHLVSKSTIVMSK